MKHQTNKMKASLTRYGFYKEEEEKEETDKESSDSDNTDN